MAGLVITESGLSIKSFQELRKEVKDAWIATFGDTIDLSPTSVDGHHIDLECKTITSIYQLLAAVISNFDVTKAKGVWLDILGDYKSMSRLQATYSIASVTFMGEEGTVIPSGTVVRYDGSPCNFELTEAVTIPSTGEVVGKCQAVTKGAVDIFVGDWKMVSSTPEGVTCKVLTHSGVGRDDETDTEFRDRIQSFSGQGYATYDKMYAYMANAIGKDQFSLRVNDEPTEIDGLPGHRFEFVINSAVGTNDTIAQLIWNCKAAGIGSYGTESGTAVDASGFRHEMRFSRTTTTSLWIKITITEYKEEVLPENYEEAIKEQVRDWAAKEYTPGKDVIPHRLYAPIYNVPGILDAEILVCVSETTPQPSDFTDEVIEVPPSEVVSVAAISVTLET